VAYKGEVPDKKKLRAIRIHEDAAARMISQEYS